MPKNSSKLYKDILVYLQIKDGQIHPNSLELAYFAKSLALKHNVKAFGIASADKLTESLEKELKNIPLCEIDFYKADIYKDFISEHFTAALVDCSQRRKPGSILVGATLEGRAIAPMAAVPLKTGVTADCTDLELDNEGLLVQTRPAYGGNVMAKIITPKARPQIATVRHGVLTVMPSQGSAKINVLKELLPSENHLPTVINKQAQKTKYLDKGSTSVILAIGGALRQKEDIELFKMAAETLDASLLCSRSLVERGWFPHYKQIGLSGRSIAPRLLICMGISGSLQFSAGIKNAEKLYAINTDKSAPIMGMADYPLVGDMYEVAKELIQP